MKRSMNSAVQYTYKRRDEYKRKKQLYWNIRMNFNRNGEKFDLKVRADVPQYVTVMWFRGNKHLFALDSRDLAQTCHGKPENRAVFSQLQLLPYIIWFLTFSETEDPKHVVFHDFHVVVFFAFSTFCERENSIFVPVIKMFGIICAELRKNSLQPLSGRYYLAQMNPCNAFGAFASTKFETILDWIDFFFIIECFRLFFKFTILNIDKGFMSTRYAITTKLKY